MIKHNSELRHIFAHMYYAFDYLGKAIIETDPERQKDYVKAAEYELESVEGLFMWDEPEEDPDGPFLNTMKEVRTNGSKEKLQRQAKEELQRQEEIEDGASAPLSK